MRSTPRTTLRTSSRAAILSLATIVALAGPTALLTGCGDDAVETPGSEAVPVDAGSLAGRTFVSTASTGFEIVDDSAVRIVFDETSLSVSANCNILGGGYEIDGATLRVGALSMTEMACEPALMDQDSRLGDLLTAAPQLLLEGDVLVISTDTQSITFLDREVADPDRPLESTTWTLTSIITDDAVSSVPVGVTATLSISDGTALVAAGCNTGSASVTVGDGTLDLGPLALTKMACGPDATAVEAAVTTVLAGTVTFEIEADVLTITGADGLDGLEYSVVAG